MKKFTCVLLFVRSKFTKNNSMEKLSGLFNHRFTAA